MKEELKIFPSNQQDRQFKEFRLVDFYCGQAAWAKGWKQNWWVSFLKTPCFGTGLLIFPYIHLSIYKSLPLQLSGEFLSLVRNQQPQMSITRIQSWRFKAPLKMLLAICQGCASRWKKPPFLLPCHLGFQETIRFKPSKNRKLLNPRISL